MKQVLYSLLSTTLLLVTLATAQAQWQLDLESGVVFNGYNQVQVPGEAGTRFSLSDELQIPSRVYYRLRLSYLWNEKHYVACQYAPLQLSAQGSFDRAVAFRQSLFDPGVPTGGDYQFNTYRFTYRYQFPRMARFQWGLGATALVRDARIALANEFQSDDVTDVGVVPLLHFYLEWFAKERLSVVFNGDAVVAPQGRAEDLLLAAHFYPSRGLTFKAGYRLLEGGADSEAVYNFALLHFAVIGMMVTL